MIRFLLIVLGACLAASVAFAGHADTDLFLPIVGRATGAGGFEYFTTLWVTNVSKEPARVRLEFLKSGESNPSPTPFAEVFRLEAGETRVLENVTEVQLKTRGIGAMRIQASQPVLATARLFSRREGENAAQTLAVSYEAIPARYAIGAGKATVLQGITLAPEFRYNVAFVETVGQPIGLRLELRDERGQVLGRKNYVLEGYEQRTASMASLFPGVAAPIAILHVKVVSGGGKVILAGSQIASLSNDSSSFVMQVHDRAAEKFAPLEIALFLIATIALVISAIVVFRRRRTPS